jgi:hypothetical protein
MDTLCGSRFFDKGPWEEVAVTTCKDVVSIHSILNRPIHFRAQSAGQKGIGGSDNSPASVVKGIV